MIWTIFVGHLDRIQEPHLFRHLPLQSQVIHSIMVKRLEALKSNFSVDPKGMKIRRDFHAVVQYDKDSCHTVFRVFLKKPWSGTVGFSPKMTLEVQPPFFIGRFPNHHYFSRDLSSFQKEPPFLKWWLTSRDELLFSHFSMPRISSLPDGCRVSCGARSLSWVSKMPTERNLRDLQILLHKEHGFLESP